VLIPEGLAELGSDFTGKYIAERMASQVTVLRIYQSSGLPLVVSGSPFFRSLGRLRHQVYSVLGADALIRPKLLTHSFFDGSDQVSPRRAHAGGEASDA